MYTQSVFMLHYPLLQGGKILNSLKLVWSVMGDKRKAYFILKGNNVLLNVVEKKCVP